MTKQFQDLRPNPIQRAKAQGDKEKGIAMLVLVILVIMAVIK